MMSRRRSAFTLIELLIVLAIIGLLAALLFAAFGPARRFARERSCASNLRQIGIAFAMYRADYDGAEAVVGQPMTPEQLGLPLVGSELFRDKYVGGRGILVCPDFHGGGIFRDMPLDSLYSTYIWSMSEEMPRPYRFSTRVGKQGNGAVVLYCESHNSAEAVDRLAARWQTKKELLLHLNGQITTKIVPTDSFPQDW
ncbi:MAG: type II secretion system protein [Chthonomonadaceae bacterium]|nr:type II secretion system protein [Chthonomonadaceae bacterium]